MSSRGDTIDLPLVNDFGYSACFEARFLPWHTHAGFEIVLILDGSVLYEIEDGTEEGKRLTLSGGEFFVSLPGQKHRAEHNIKSPSKLFWVIFDPAAPDACRNTVFQPSDLARAAAFCRDRADQAVAFPPALSDLLHALRDALKTVPSAFNAAWQRSLVCQIILTATHAPPMESERYPACVKSAIARMEQDFDKDLRMSEVAAGLGVSAPRFYRLFHEATGHTPNDYLLRLRVRNAQTLLAEGSRSVTEITFAVGFNSSQYFCKAFRKYTGETPTAYRQGMKKGQGTFPAPFCR